MRYFNNPEALLRLIGTLSDGFGNTLVVFFATLVFSIPLGMLVALLEDGTLAKITANWFANDVTIVANYADQVK